MRHLMLCSTARRRAKPAKSANTFGGSISGPIVGKRTFFFGDYEGMRYRTQTVLHETLPTQAMWNGDFTTYFRTMALLLSPCITLTEQSIRANRSPRINPVATKIQPFYPLPNPGDPNVFVMGAINFVKTLPILPCPTSSIFASTTPLIPSRISSDAGPTRT